MSKILREAAKQNITFTKETVFFESDHDCVKHEIKIKLKAPPLRRSFRRFDRQRNIADGWKRRSMIMLGCEEMIRKTVYSFLGANSMMAEIDYVNGRRVSDNKVLLCEETAKGTFGFTYPLLLLSTELINKEEIILVLACYTGNAFPEI